MKKSLDSILDDFVLVDYVETPNESRESKKSWYRYLKRIWSQTNIILCLILLYMYVLYKRDSKNPSKF